MNELRKARWRDYFESVGIALGFSFFFALGLSRILHMHPLVMIFLYGVPFGTNVYIAKNYLSPRLRHRSFVLTVLGEVLAYVYVIVASFTFSLWPSMAFMFGTPLFSATTFRNLGHILTLPLVIYPAIACFLLMNVVGSIFAVSRKLGPGVLRNWITGKYHNPKAEERIFMFLDLKSSTTLAEQLGPLAFSALVRDFFRELTVPLIKTKGEVSHYIGDEAVLTWKPRTGLLRANCVECFFLMKDEIAKHSLHYLQTYGLVPEFKASIHIGPVVACEVGDLKSEIVYHGDVLNTAARIQGLCNELGCDLLISGDLAEKLQAVLKGRLKSKGLQRLKGKENEVEVLEVRPPADTVPYPAIA